MSHVSGPARVIGRYAIYDEIASGGMATVHLGRLLGSVGFSRTVAIKCLHAHLAKDPEFVKMFLDEARLAARVQHPNVVPTLDVVNTDGQLFLVMEYVEGESLARLMRAVQQHGHRVPVPVACAVMAGVLQGLHAAHEATDERGEKLGIVHRDVSPQNIMVGLDGVAHVFDFGVAKATGRLQTTRDGRLKGKLAYMAPEQVRAAPVTRAADVYSAGVVFWELLTGARLFRGENEANVLERVLYGEVHAPSARGAALPTELDRIVLRALSRSAAERFQTAREMARAIESAVPVATASEVSEWVEALAGEMLDGRQRRITEIESGSDPLGGSPARDAAREDPRVDEPTSDRSRPPSSYEATTDATLPDKSSLSRGRFRPWAAWIGASAVAAVAVTVLVARHHGVSAAQPEPSVDTDTRMMSQASSSPGPPTNAPQPASDSATAGASVPPTDMSARGAAPATMERPAPRRRRAEPRPPSGRAAPDGSKPEIVHDFPGSTPAPPRARPGCTPPYTIDAQGVKQYKVQCL